MGIFGAKVTRVNAVRAVISVFALIGMGICRLSGVDAIDSSNPNSLKEVILLGFGILAGATIAAGALNPAQAAPQSPGGQGRQGGRLPPGQAQ
ncbi:hypothetical protein ACQP1W_11090 [Spirillospora sp. CA-255316]